MLVLHGYCAMDEKVRVDDVQCLSRCWTMWTSIHRHG